MRTHDRERKRPGPQSGWMVPVEANESSDQVGLDMCDSGRRASRKGLLTGVSLVAYLELLDWTGQHWVQAPGSPFTVAN